MTTEQRSTYFTRQAGGHLFEISHMSLTKINFIFYLQVLRKQVKSALKKNPN